MEKLSLIYVSLLIKNGIDARTIADRVGRTRTSMTLDVYARLFDEHLTAAAISLIDFLPKTNQIVMN